MSGFPIPLKKAIFISVATMILFACMPSQAITPTVHSVTVTPSPYNTSLLPTVTGTITLVPLVPIDKPASDIKSLALAIAPNAEAVVLYGIPHPVPYAPPSWEIMYLPVSAEGEPLAPPQIWFETNNFSRLLPSPDRKYLAVVYEDEWGSFGKILNVMTGEFSYSYLDLADPRFEGWASDSSGILHTFDVGRGLALIGKNSQILVEDINDPDPNAQITGATLSPDGKTVMYALSTSQIWILNRETGERHQIITSADFNLVVDFLSWSPNGDWIAAHSQDGLKLMRPDGSEWISIVDNLCSEQNYYPEWNSLGNEIVCENSFPEREVKFPFNRLGYAIYMNPLGEFNVKQVIPETTGIFFNPSWLPNGDSVLTVGWMPGDNLDIFLSDENGEIKQLTFDGKRKFFPVWFDLDNVN